MSLLLLSGLAMTFSSAADAQGHGPASHPIALEVHEHGNTIDIRVTGAADRPTDARYTLTASGAASGGNRTVQSGTAHLVPGRPAVLLSLSMTTAGPGQWQAMLEVQPASAPAYTIDGRSSDASP